MAFQRHPVRRPIHHRLRRLRQSAAGRCAVRQGCRIWATELAYWKDGSPAHGDAVRSKLTPDAVRNQYVAGTRDPSLIDPDNWTIDSALLARPGVDEIMLDLPYDIRNNRQTVADARQFFKTHQRQIKVIDLRINGYSRNPLSFRAWDAGQAS